MTREEIESLAAWHLDGLDRRIDEIEDEDLQHTLRGVYVKVLRGLADSVTETVTDWGWDESQGEMPDALLDRTWQDWILRCPLEVDRLSWLESSVEAQEATP